jgi:hypothetical protein
MSVIEGILAFVGLVALIVVVVAIMAPEKPQQQEAAAVEDDLAAPYREGLYAAMRMQGAAQDLEQRIYSEALSHREQMPPGA